MEAWPFRYYYVQYYLFPIWPSRTSNANVPSGEIKVTYEESNGSNNSVKAKNTITEPDTVDEDENKMPSHLKMALHNLLIREENENCSGNQFTNNGACNGNIDITQGFILVRLHSESV